MSSQNAWVIENHNSTSLAVIGNTINITTDQLNYERGKHARGQCTISEHLHNLLAASLVPLTDNSPPTNNTTTPQATTFLRAFAHQQVEWVIHTEGLPHNIHSMVAGTTANAWNPLASYRFLRFRFPLVDFEWHVQTLYHKLAVLAPGTAGEAETKVQWKMWAKTGNSSGLVAYGFITDRIILNAACHLEIRHRDFYVTRVILPELIAPIPLPLEPLEPPYKNDLAIFSTSQTVLHFLRSCYKILAFLMSLSALLAPAQPVVDKKNFTAGLVLAIVGIFTAAISVIAAGLGWVLA
ncbi:hypothetical protein B0H10DRAFT_2191107 [Mycena sp. CBHHK59/15]|nr:hypothetical protein B0H10DRAFT_2191107 [Mycena sp. CBHHK59/15]